jgi:outer membrane autotransporter protein
VQTLSNAGNVRFGSAGTSVGFQPTVLTVTGNYVGNNGTLSMSTVLGNDSSKTDRLEIGGNASGTTHIALANAGGLGALTAANGIMLVKVGGTSADDAFDLTVGGRDYIDAGAYRYRLFQGPLTGADENWYLRSQASGIDPQDMEPETRQAPER